MGSDPGSILGNAPDTAHARAPVRTRHEYRSAHFVLRADPLVVTRERLAALAAELEATRTGCSELIGAQFVPREPIFVDLSISPAATPHAPPLPSAAFVEDIAARRVRNDSGATRVADPYLLIAGVATGPSDGLKRALIALLLRAAFGGGHDGQGPGTSILLDGICGFLASESAATQPAAIPTALARMLTRKRVLLAAGSGSVLASILGGPTAQNRRYYAEALASFVGFLIATFGVERFRDLARRLSSSTARTVDAAAVAAALDAVYGQTLAALEREWRAGLPAAPAEKHGLLWVVVTALKYWRPYWLIGLAIAGLVCLQDYFGSAFADALGRITDTATSRDPKVVHSLGSLVIGLATGLAIWYLITVAAAVGQNYLTARASASILNDLRRRMFAHLQRLSMRFYTHAQSGDVVAHFTSDLTDVDKGLTSRLPDGYFSIIGIAFWGTSMFVRYGQIALVMVAVIPLLVASTLFFARPTVDATYRLKRQQAALASLVQENVKTQPVIKVFALQDTALARIEQLLSDLWHTAIRANFLGQTMGTASALAVALLTVSFPLFGALLVAHGILSIGSLIAANTLFGLITGEAYNLTKKVIPTLLSSSGAMTRIEELLAEPGEVTDAADAVELPMPTRQIRLENVAFGYERDRLILDHVNLSVPIGQFIGLVGPSGSGKSTILNLLLRFYDPTQGTVTIDGFNLRHVTQASLHAHIAAVFQDHLLFDLSIRDNIRMGNLQATNEEIEAAARGAEIHDLIMSLPQGYDSKTGEMGGMLSGGQRQRLSIARAIVRNPTILLLDEPTSALDPATESAIMATIERLARQRTVIVVTHRLAAIEHADTIVVLQSGVIREQGTHAELLGQDGLYAELWNKQHGIEVSQDGRQATLQMSRLQSMPLFDVPLFMGLDARVLALLASQFSPVPCAAGSVVAREGEPARDFYLIARGKLEVIATDVRGNERSVALLDDGDYFGEVALLESATYDATLRAVEDSLVLALSCDRFAKLAATLPQLSAAVARAANHYRLQGTVGNTAVGSTVDRLSSNSPLRP